MKKVSVIKLYKNGVEVEGKQNRSEREGIDDQAPGVLLFFSAESWLGFLDSLETLENLDQIPLGEGVAS